MQITEINIVPIKPNNGLVAIASVVVEDCLYLGSIGVYTKLDGSGYRITYPTKSVNSKNFNIFHPIRKDLALEIERVVLERAQKVLYYQTERSNENARYRNTNRTARLVQS